MHPKAYEHLVGYERNKRAEISIQLAALALEFEASLARELAIPLPESSYGE